MKTDLDSDGALEGNRGTSKDERNPSLWSVLTHFRRPILRALGLVAAMFFFLVAARTLLEVPFYPWARSFSLWPTLTGDWYGDLLTPAGRIPVYIEIRSTFTSNPASRPQHAPDITGRLQWCEAGGAIHAYDIWGDVENWRGTRFRLSMRSLAERDSGASPSGLTAEWDGDTIEAVGTFVRHERTATAAASRGSAAADEALAVRYALRRGGAEEFLAACRGSRQPPNGRVR